MYSISPIIKINGLSDGNYYYQVYDGPDGIDECSGTAESLEEVFRLITEFREMVARSYVEA
jgi:hypothetical protein